VLGQTFCYGSTSFDWVDQNYNAQLIPEFQIIQKPGDPDKHYSFYTHLYGGADHHFLYNEISFENGQPNELDGSTLLAGLDGYVAFAITPDAIPLKYLYVSTGRVTYNETVGHLAGIRQFEITPTGVEFVNTILDESDNDFDQWGFDAYNLELKIDDNDNTVIAYIHGTENTVHNQIVTELIVVIDGDGEKYELNSGRLTGIEFSSNEEHIIYVSSANGILKVDYNTGQVLQTLIANDYQRTFLQTAPDGQIYGVSNTGTSLGQINMQYGTFTPD